MPKIATSVEIYSFVGCMLGIKVSWIALGTSACTRKAVAISAVVGYALLLVLTAAIPPGFIRKAVAAPPAEAVPEPTSPASPPASK